MNCQRCGTKTVLDDQKFCITCGWDLSKEMPKEPEPTEPAPLVCPFCQFNLPNVVRLNVCPLCGKYIGKNAGYLHLGLVSKALGWTGGGVGFCTNVLGIPMRIARVLCNPAYYNLQPIQVLELKEAEVLAMKGLGVKSYMVLKKAIRDWKP